MGKMLVINGRMAVNGGRMVTTDASSCCCGESIGPDEATLAFTQTRIHNAEYYRAPPAPNSDYAYNKIEYSGTLNIAIKVRVVPISTGYQVFVVNGTWRKEIQASQTVASLAGTINRSLNGVLLCTNAGSPPSVPWNDESFLSFGTPCKLVCETPMTPWEWARPACGGVSPVDVPNIGTLGTQNSQGWISTYLGTPLSQWDSTRYPTNQSIFAWSYGDTGNIALGPYFPSNELGGLWSRDLMIGPWPGVIYNLPGTYPPTGPIPASGAFNFAATDRGFGIVAQSLSWSSTRARLSATLASQYSHTVSKTPRDAAANIVQGSCNVTSSMRIVHGTNLQLYCPGPLGLGPVPPINSVDAARAAVASALSRMAL